MLSIGAAAAGGKRETAERAATPREERPKWHDDVGVAFAEARGVHKPLLAVLHCPH